MKIPAATVAFVFAAASWSDTITVCLDGSCDFDEIQRAIDYASDGDEVQVHPGTYTSSAGQIINMHGKSVTLQSIEGPDSTILDGQGVRRGICCVSGESNDCQISGFTFQNCWAPPFDFNGNDDIDYWEDGGAGCLFIDSDPVVTNCIFTNNSGQDGAAIGLFSSSPEIEDCVFQSNIANGMGGAIQGQFNSSPSVMGCEFLENSSGIPPSAGSGGAIYISGGGSPTFTENIFSENTSDMFGAIGLEGVSSALIVECNFKHNVADFAGGIAATTGGSITISSCSFEGNESGFHGGHAVYSDTNTLPSLKDSIFDECCQVYGSFNDGGGNTFAGNEYNTCDSCRADLTCYDGVDGSDLTVLLSAWGTSSVSTDLNEDGLVDGADLTILLAAWGPCP